MAPESRIKDPSCIITQMYILQESDHSHHLLRSWPRSRHMTKRAGGSSVQLRGVTEAYGGYEYYLDTKIFEHPIILWISFSVLRLERAI